MSERSELTIEHSALPPDVIEIRGIRGFGRHGVFEHERADGQEFT